jgi:uncharacterized Zn finger protein
MTASVQCKAKPASATSRQVMNDCPDCSEELAVMRIIGGRGGSEYWTLRCVGCGGIHLDIVKGSPPA